MAGRTGYSKTYKVKGRLYRYSYDRAEIEWISWFDYDTEDGEMVEVKLAEPRALASIGLSPDEWADGPEYWVNVYAADIDEEIAAELALLQGEL